MLVVKANESIELFLALLAFLALSGSAAVLIARFSGATVGRQLLAGLA